MARARARAKCSPPCATPCTRSTARARRRHRRVRWTLIRSGKVLGDWCDAFEDFCVARSRLTDDVSLACTNQFHTLAAYYPVRHESLIDIDDNTVHAFDAHSTRARSDAFNLACLFVE